MIIIRGPFEQTFSSVPCIRVFEGELVCNVEETVEYESLKESEAPTYSVNETPGVRVSSKRTIDRPAVWYGSSYF